jgi:hypothetical protein
MNLVGNIHGCREEKLTAILQGKTEVEACQTWMLLKPQQNPNYLKLSCYQVPIHDVHMPFHDVHVHGNLLWNVYKVNLEETGSSTGITGFFLNHHVHDVLPPLVWIGVAGRVIQHKSVGPNC